MNVVPLRKESSANGLRKRRQLGGFFAAIILIFYFGFALLIAFLPGFLAIGAPFSVGFVLIIIHVAAVVLLNALYMTRTQHDGAAPDARANGAGQ